METYKIITPNTAKIIVRILRFLVAFHNDENNSPYPNDVRAILLVTVMFKIKTFFRDFQYELGLKDQNGNPVWFKHCIEGYVKLLLFTAKTTYKQKKFKLYSFCLQREASVQSPTGFSRKYIKYVGPASLSNYIIRLY